MQLIPTLLFLLLGYSLHRTNGFLKFNHLLYLSMGFLFYSSNLYKKINFKYAQVKPELALSVLCLIFSLLINFRTNFFYPENSQYLYLFNINGVFISILALINVTFCYLDKKKLSINLSKILILMVLINYLIVPIISPIPLIDVHLILTQGSDHLLNGLNPYAQKYPDILNGRYGYVAGYVYWPSILLATIPARFFNIDVRYTHFFALLVTIFLLWKIMKRKEVTPNVAILSILTWLLFPVGYFCLEQSWTEILMIPILLGVLYFIDKGQIVLGALTLGLFGASKQYNLFAGIAVLIFVYKKYNFRLFLKFSLVSIISFSLVMMPFLLANPVAFYKETIHEILSYQVRNDSLSWYSYLHLFYQVHIPKLVTLFVYLFPLYLIKNLLWQKVTIDNLLTGIFISYFLIFIFSKQAFCNYYYFASLLLLFSINLNQKKIGAQN